MAKIKRCQLEFGRAMQNSRKRHLRRVNSWQIALELAAHQRVRILSSRVISTSTILGGVRELFSGKHLK